MSALIINYGMGNLGSVLRACEECGFDAFISDNPDDIKNADKLILPGVGHFAEAMKNLNQTGWSNAIKTAIQNNIPLLGICLGMQLLCTDSEEGSDGTIISGLDILKGHIKKIDVSDHNLRVPHVGWNDIQLNPSAPSLYLDGIKNGTDFYFVHSYHAVMDNPNHVLATTDYGNDITAIIGENHVIGTQFHPEKSSRYGFQTLKNFLGAY
jgi:glutamine amidotransferase